MQCPHCHKAIYAYLRFAPTDELTPTEVSPVQPDDEWKDATALTQRHRDVLRLIGSGYSNKEIAKELGLAENTVKNHSTATMRRLGCNDRTQAVMRALDLGILTRAGEELR